MSKTQVSLRLSKSAAAKLKSVAREVRKPPEEFSNRANVQACRLPLLSTDLQEYCDISGNVLWSAVTMQRDTALDQLVFVCGLCAFA
jgi:hypothetical protein